MKALRLSIGEDLAAGTLLSQPANENIIRLVAGEFTPDENLVVADLTFATFTGSTALDVGLDDQLVGIDPTTGEQLITLIEPVGGWRWECTATPGAPQNIYGFALLTAASAALLAVEAFPEPITIQEIGQEINLGTAKFTVTLSPMS